MKSVFFAALLCFLAIVNLNVGSQAAIVNLSVDVTAPTTSVAFVPPTGDVIHFMSTTGNDSNNGLTAATAWATPNHPLNCGDVIIAAAGNYPVLQTWGAVSKCPSTTGGIDGTGGVNFAVLLCAGNVGTCEVNHNTGHDFAIDVNQNNWGVEGWLASEGYKSGASGFGFTANTGTNLIHHTAFINDISTFNASGFTVDTQGNGTGGGGLGWDYVALIGDIGQDSAGRNDCCFDAAFDIIGIMDFDTKPGTHILVDGNFGIKDLQTTGGISDGECFMMDSPDTYGYDQTLVFKDNIATTCERFGMELTYSDFTVDSLTFKFYNNTIYNGTTGTDVVLDPNKEDQAYGDINYTTDITDTGWIVSIYGNLDFNSRANGIKGTIDPPGTDGSLYPLIFFQNVINTTVGLPGKPNFFKGSNTACQGSICDAGNNVLIGTGGTATELSAMVNNYTNPGYANMADVPNQIGTPNCSAFATTTACMAPLIADLTPTAAGTAGLGYQSPGVCAADADYPVWLKGIVVLQWSAATSTVTENSGLINKPCGM